MSLEKFGFSSERSVSVPSTSQACSSTVQQPICPPPKKRRFNSAWKHCRDWLQHDVERGVMFCDWCRRFSRSEVRNQFVSGSTSMKLESIKKHEQSLPHKEAAGAHRAQCRPDQAPMDLAIQSMERSEMEQMKKLFTSAYYLVQVERPFRDFTSLLNLQRLNGLCLGQAYANAKQARTFVHFIAEEIRNDLVHLLRDCAFFSVCMDSSTDKATIDEEMVQIRVLKDNTPVYQFVAVKPLAKADAASTVGAIVSALETECECSDWRSKLVGICADGAAVNMGVRSGAVKRLKDEVPHLVPIHCCAHRVELAIKSMSTEVNYFKTLEDTLVELYKFYHKSPLCWSGLQQVGNVLQVQVLKPTKLTGTRWVGHRHRALKVMLDGWVGFVTHFSQTAQSSTQNKERARHLHTTFTSLKFFLFSRACAEYFGAIQHFSKVLQYDGITTDGFARTFAATQERLGNMLSTITSAISAMAESLGDSMSYQGETLKVPRGYANVAAVVTAVTALLQKLLSGTISDLNTRFSSFSTNPILLAASVFSPFSWPLESSALAEFGYDKIHTLSSHFALPLHHGGYSPESCIEEWPELKLRVKEILRNEPAIQYLTMWQRVLHEYEQHQALTNILALLHIVLVIPVQTATLERGFSLMKSTKTDWRNRLTPNTLSQLIMIKLNGPDINHFDPVPAIGKWWRAGPRSRRPRTASGEPTEEESSDSEEEY